jgi:hypothetical protein
MPFSPFPRYMPFLSSKYLPFLKLPHIYISYSLNTRFTHIWTIYFPYCSYFSERVLWLTRGLEMSCAFEKEIIWTGCACKKRRGWEQFLGQEFQCLKCAEVLCYISMLLWWNNWLEKQLSSHGRNLPRCKYFHRKSHTNWTFHGEEPENNSESHAREFSSWIQLAQNRAFLLPSLLSKTKCAFVEARE